jgi:LacI family transcriptional regulator
MVSEPTRAPARVTLNDVAMAAGVDRSVVSRVITGDPRLNVRPQTRQRVQETVRRLGYRPNVAARSLRTSRAFMFGVFVADRADPLGARITDGAEPAAAALGCGLLTGSLRRLGAGRYRELLGQGRVDGVVLAGEPDPAVLAALASAGVPWIGAGVGWTTMEGASGAARRVRLDEEPAAALAVGHLTGLGHRRIARLSATCAAEAAGELRRRWTAEAPTAVLADSRACVGVLHAAHADGIAVPGELSVVGLPELPPAAHLAPGLTAVRMPVADLGRRAIELLVERAPDEDIDEVVEGSGELIERASTGPAPPRR